MSGFTFRLGPFQGGLNNATNTPDTIQDHELFECIDFDYNIDNTLVTRPPVAIEALTTLSIDNKYFNLLGYYVDPTSQSQYLVAEIAGDLYYRINSTSYKDAGTWTLIQAAFGTASCGIQYVNQFYIVSSSGAGYSWSPTSGAAPVAAMPAGSSVALFKERMWISSGTSSRLYFSNIGDPTTWSSSDFADVNAGDGQYLTAVYAGPASLYLFKTSSTFVLIYDSSPTRGAIQNISTTIGLYNTQCITEYENNLYLLYGTHVYSLVGYSYARINDKVDITRDSVVDSSYKIKYAMSTVGDRIMVSYYNNTFAYYPLINTWTKWDMPQLAKWVEVPNSILLYGYKIFMTSINQTAPVAGSILELQDKVYDITMPPDIVRGDPQIITRMYSMDFYRRAIYDTPDHWKRLYWWGIDAIVSELDNDAYVKMSILPYVFTDTLSWQLMSNETWGELDLKTWGDLKTDPFSITTIVHVTEPNRKFIKASKSVRFTRIQFRLSFPNYRHTAVSSINHVTINFSSKQNPVALGEGSPVTV